MDTAMVARWVDRYVHAWNTNDPTDIGRLFTSDAVYYHSPFAPGWHGRDTIIREWLSRQDAPDTTTFRYRVLSAGVDLGVVRGWTYYQEPPREYSNLWLISFDAYGNCREFTEWWMERDAD